MKRLVIIFCLLLTLPSLAFAQEYAVPDITVSKDKVRVDGKTYYAHVVTAKQTLFSISKAYNVSVDDIYSANEHLDLETKGIKVGQVLLIPISKKQPTNPEPVKIAADAPVQTKTETPAETVTSEEKELEGTTDEKALFPRLKDFANKVMGIEEDSTAVSGEEYIKEIPDVINVALLMPFNTGAKADEKSLDFYAGALLAAKDLGNKGRKINITALDVTISNPDGKKVLEDADVIIGPISSDGILNALQSCSRSKYIVSPLDPKAASLAEGHHVIQAPTPAARQYRELARWVKDDLQQGDSVLVVTQTGVVLSEGGQALMSELANLGIPFSEINYSTGSSQGRFAMSSRRGTNRYIVVSESESFVNDVVRNVSLMSYKGLDVALYAASKIRNFGTIDADQLHRSDTHIAASYYVDYSDPQVQKFVRSYRALCEAEPNSFAFHGYDTMHYFVNICAEYGRKWPLKLSEYSENGLQTGFRFDANDPEGKVNAAVRRVELTPNLKTKLLK